MVFVCIRDQKTIPYKSFSALEENFGGEIFLWPCGRQTIIKKKVIDFPYKYNYIYTISHILWIETSLQADWGFYDRWYSLAFTLVRIEKQAIGLPEKCAGTR